MGLIIRIVLFVALLPAGAALAQEAPAQPSQSQTQPASPAGQGQVAQPQDQAQPSTAPPGETAQQPAASASQKTQVHKLTKPSQAHAKKTHKSHSVKHTARRRKKVTPQTATKPGDPSGKVVVRNGGADEALIQIAPQLTQEQQLHNRENTTELLATTDANLKSIAGRPLTPAQQGMLDQIHSYMRQSRSASDSGDLVRAHTLAFKAHLLSDELAKK